MLILLFRTFLVHTKLTTSIIQKCTTNIRRQSTSKVCCRDPNFKSEEEDYDDFGNMDYMDFDQVYTYNMKPYMKNE